MELITQHAPSQHNIRSLKLQSCVTCGGYGWPDDGVGCKRHSPGRAVDSYTHYYIAGTWYTTPYKYKFLVCTLLNVDTGMHISGALDYPKPLKIKNLTELLTLCVKQGITDDALVKYFPEDQVKRMKGRVLKRLVRGQRQSYA